MPNSDAPVPSIEEIKSRADAAEKRLATLLQMLAEGRPLGGALVGRSGPWTDADAQSFEEFVKSHDGATGALREALMEAGYEVIELPETIYGALTPDVL